MQIKTVPSIRPIDYFFCGKFEMEKLHYYGTTSDWKVSSVFYFPSKEVQDRKLPLCYYYYYLVTENLSGNKRFFGECLPKYLLWLKGSRQARVRKEKECVHFIINFFQACRYAIQKTITTSMQQTAEIRSSQEATKEEDRTNILNQKQKNDLSALVLLCVLRKCNSGLELFS